jgi:hypothetical protein
MSFLIEFLTITYIGLVLSVLLFAVVWSIHKTYTQEQNDDFFKYHRIHIETVKPSYSPSVRRKQQYSAPGVQRVHQVQRRARVGGVPDINGWGWGGRDGRQQQKGKV